MSIEEKIASLGYSLPVVPAPAGCYLPYRFVGNQLVVSGVLAMREGQVTHEGQVGNEQTVASGKEAAAVCALNVLAQMKAALGDLSRVKQLVILNGFVNAVAGFTESPAVINGASELFLEVLGDAGQHARAAVAVAGLPLGSTVEIQVTAEFE